MSAAPNPGDFGPDVDIPIDTAPRIAELRLMLEDPTTCQRQIPNILAVLTEYEASRTPEFIYQDGRPICIRDVDLNRPAWVGVCAYNCILLQYFEWRREDACPPLSFSNSSYESGTWIGLSGHPSTGLFNPPAGFPIAFESSPVSAGDDSNCKWDYLAPGIVSGGAPVEPKWFPASGPWFPETAVIQPPQPGSTRLSGAGLRTTFYHATLPRGSQATVFAERKTHLIQSLGPAV
ncbi:hypothetical protein EYR41_005162 [Orbilia oligospora]|uniref:Uncharacterized protein n=1 Tax=Orbilia oligospora TaxID=2813651 RepID=A0A7C8PXH7_ORBOL|nr:hypothetical protein TWF751_006045 [Orbilia oligospora]TGJ69095.1 hypothetical protein EYR41_005162 [Orbilia oligospora]